MAKVNLLASTQANLMGSQSENSGKMEQSGMYGDESKSLVDLYRDWTQKNDMFVREILDVARNIDDSHAKLRQKMEDELTHRKQTNALLLEELERYDRCVAAFFKKFPSYQQP